VVDRVSFVVGLVALLIAGLVLLDAGASVTVDPRIVAGVLVALVGAGGLAVSWLRVRGRRPPG
jgi:hypothetical protein